MNMTQTIGDSYMTWRKGSYIFIRAGTGTGKTYFVLHILYEYAINQGCTIVLLVNRRILKQQILCDLKKYDAKRKRKRHLIRIFTYQELESSSPDSWQHQCVQDADYIVCDEAHYFLADSTFNPGTVKSFDLIMELLPDIITIFMTATPTKIMPVIQERVASDYEKGKRTGTKRKLKEFSAMRTSNTNHAAIVKTEANAIYGSF